MLKLILLIAVLGIIIYVGIRLLQERGGDAGRGGRPEFRPLAPDDDPEFLRDLDRKRRKDESDPT